jgi:hypothetical protein
MKSPEETPELDLGEVTGSLHRDEDSSIWLRIKATDLPDLVLPLSAKSQPEVEEFALTFVHMVRGLVRLAAGKHPNLPKHMKAMEEDLPAFQRFLLSEFSWGPSIQGRN